jgi:outer membrane protein OmpA-like peptidoglycan-associated protein
MSKTSQGVGKLRELLFDEEAQRLASLDGRVGEVDGRLRDVDAKLADVASRVEAMGQLTAQEQRLRTELAHRLDTVFERAGTRDRFQNSIADVLDEAIVLAEERNHKQVARAVAPLVVTTVKTELRNSQDEMVEALYPITGRLVQAYVASAMRELSEKINRRLSQNSVMLRLRSLTTGRSVAELAMAAEADLTIEEVFLIRRGSGELIAQWPFSGAPSNHDIHMGGILSSITDFANHAFEDEGGHIRSFEADTFQIFLRASPMYIVAAKCAGTPPPGFEREFDTAFFAALDGFDGAPDDVAADAPPVLERMAGTLTDRLADTRQSGDTAVAGFGALKLLLFLIAVPVFAWLGWSAFTALEESRVRSAANAAVAGISELRGYQTEIDVGYRGRTLSVAGLTPNEAVRERLLGDLRAAVPDTTRVVADLGTLPRAVAIDTRPEIARLQTEIETLRQQARVDGVRADVRRNVALARARIGAVVGDMSTVAAQTNGDDERLRRVAGMRADATALRDRLDALAGALATPQPDLPGLRSSVARELEQGRDEINRMLERLDLTQVATRDAAGDVPGADLIGASESLALGTERLAVAVAALREAPIITPPPVASVTPLERLRRWTAVNAVFFSNGTQLRDPNGTGARLDTLARLMKESGQLVRLVGYTDERGGLSRNNTLSLARAERVRDELVDRGVPERLIVVVGRAGNGVDISTVVGEASPNRRVEFEVGFIGEAGSR